MGSGNAGQPATPSRPRHNNNTTHGLKRLDDDIDDELTDDDPKRILVTATTALSSVSMSMDPKAASTAVAGATITLLDLSCSKLAWLPRERFVGCVGVTELVLNNNRLSRLPHELFALPNVRVARFEFNELVDLPAEIGQWSASLEVLVANNNRLKKLPPQMGRLKRLRQLNLHCNQLVTLPTSLLELDVRVFTLHANPALSENLKRIYQAVFSLREDTLDLSHCGPIRDQVEEQALSYARLTRELRLEGNALHSLPTAVGRFFRLQSLMVDDNQISAIPVHLCKLPAITRLSMADNKLAHLPAEIGLLTSLRFINMDNNFLSVLPPSFFHLVNLEELSLANNKIESVSGTDCDDVCRHPAD
jgi:Leucine-rich repeat (LRR) protein